MNTDPRLTTFLESLAPVGGDLTAIKAALEIGEGVTSLGDLTATGMTAGSFLSVGPNDTVIETLPADVRAAIGAAPAADPTFTGTMMVLGNAQLNSQVALGGWISVDISGTYNDWNPTGLSGANTIYVNPTIMSVITGIAGGAGGRIIRIVNTSSTNSITLTTEGGASTDVNRFKFNDGILLTPSSSIVLSYDSGSLRWRSFGFTPDRTGVAGGSYTNPTITVGSDGRITSATSGSGSKLQFKNASFTAEIGGRYLVDGNTLPTVADPSSVGASVGDSYEVLIYQGIVNVGGSYLNPSRVPLVRRYTGSGWTTFSTPDFNTITVGSNTWNGSTFTGNQSFSGNSRPTSSAVSPALTSSSLITKSDFDTLIPSTTDTRYSQKEVYSSVIGADTGAQVTNSTTLVNTGLSLSLLPAGTYLIQCVVKAYSITSNNGGWRFQLTTVGMGTLNSNILYAIGTGSAGMSNSISSANTAITTAASAPHFVGTISDVITLTGSNTTLSIQHANETATATAGRGIRQGSYLRAIRLT